MIVILAIGPLFKTLPNVAIFDIDFKLKKNFVLLFYIFFKSCLGAIIVVSIISLIIEVRQFWVILKRSKFEAVSIFFFFIWLELFLSF